MKPPLTLAQLIDLVAQLERDEELPHAELCSRDRKIGRELAVMRQTSGAQLGGWLNRVHSSSEPSAGRRAETALRIGLLALVVVGAALGWLAAVALFYYDGSRPVNVIHVLAVFVGLQLLLLLLLGFTMVPEKIQRIVPGMRSLQEALSLLSPGRLHKHLARYLPARFRTSTASLIGRTSAHRKLFGGVEKWLVVRTGQAFGMAFNLGALAGCLYLIVFTDLAFGWSTTLKAQAQDIQQITDALAAPWSAVLPQARPSPELIEATRYFRLHPGSLNNANASGPQIYGEWWPFIILCILVYGLLPRIILLLVSHWRLRVALSHTVAHHPGIQSLLSRLNTQLVETQAHEPEVGAVTERGGAVHHPVLGNLQGKPLIAIDWSDTGLSQKGLADWLHSNLGGSLASLHQAGGARSLAEDRALVNTAFADNPHGVFILVKAWEPPMAEFRDFLEELRRQAGKDLPLGIVPLGLGSTEQVLPPQTELLRVWEAAVDQLGDPWTFIIPVSKEGGV